jgi:dinuclear metal center YbgI/SA1388 family protein
MVRLRDIAASLDELLCTGEVPDYPAAHNGVQFENSGNVQGVAAAVDLSLRTIRLARAEGANLLLVHHGLLWNGAEPIVGDVYRRVRALLEHDIAVYASHIPLDVHPQFGNNALLAKELSLQPTGGFGRFQGIHVGVMGDSDIQTFRLIENVRAFAAEHSSIIRHTASDDTRITRRWAICTGAGASSDTLLEAVELGVDTLIVGEGPHHTAVRASDMGLVVVYAGHYATETLGVRALAEYIGRTFVIPWSFVSAPTGL